MTHIELERECAQYVSDMRGAFNIAAEQFDFVAYGSALASLDSVDSRLDVGSNFSASQRNDLQSYHLWTQLRGEYGHFDDF